MNTPKIITPQQHINDIIVKVGSSIAKSTCQIFSLNHKSQPIPTGSGIFLKLSNYYFLISAAHVVKGIGKEIFIPYQNDINSIAGEAHYTKYPENDKNDIMIMKIDDDNVPKLKQYDFVSIEDVLINHKIENTNNYLCYGYPSSKTKKYNRAIQTKVFLYRSKNASADKYKNLNFQKHSHILIDYDRKNIFASDKIQTGPEPYGISGSGLWYIPSFSIDANDIIPKKLVGILIEYHKKYNVMAAVRIHIVTEAIKKLFKINLQNSIYTEVNILN